MNGISKEYGELYDGLSKREDQIFTFNKMDLRQPPADTAGQLKRISRCLVHMWLMRSLKRPRLRGAIYILFAIGLTLIAIPAVFTFLQVSFVAVKRPFA